MTVRSLVLVVLIFMIAACGDSRPRVDAQENTNISAGKQKPTDKPTATASQETAISPTTLTDTKLRVALDGEGLRLFNPSSGSARLIAFGTSSEPAMTSLNVVQGEKSIRNGENFDCGARYAEWSNGLTVWFARDRFVGWSVQRSSDALTTASSIGVGSTLEELNAAYDAKIARSSLGMEFTAGGIAGLLDSSKANARIKNLWAGTACVAR